jgi:uncharacterized membrane protein
MSDWFNKHKESLNLQDRIADRITRFSGSMIFVYIHIVGFTGWMLFLEKSPWSKLTLVVSLEAIFLATFVMISQNRQAERDKIQAQHQYEHQELELEENTKLTKEIHKLSNLVYNILDKKRNK